MNHRWLVSLLLTLFILQLSPSHAQHYIGAAIAGHMTMGMDDITATHAKPAFGGELGGVYAWQKGSLLVQTGLQYALLSAGLSMDDTQLEQEMLDTRGVRFTYLGDLINRTDKLYFGQLAVPLYIGGTWHGIYALAGAKLTVNLHAKTAQQAQLRTVGDYQGRYYDLFENMPNHGYHDYEPVASSEAVSLRPLDVRIGGELGYTVELSRQRGTAALPPLLRIGAFVEYGLLNQCSPATRSDAPASIEPDFTHYMSVAMHHIYTSSDASTNAAHWFTCGIRVTFLYPVSTGKHGCNCYGK